MSADFAAQVVAQSTVIPRRSVQHMRADSQHLIIQETKLVPPAKKGAVVERPRLLAHALKGSQERLTLLSAAAGYGKTSLLAQVYGELRHRDSCVAWVSLDETDNDHARFLSHLVSSIRKSKPGFGSQVGSLLRSGAASPAEILRITLLNDLGRLEEDTFVFLDDYHVVSSSEVNQTVAEILSAALPRVHLLIASRTSPSFSVSRLRARGELTEMQAVDLAFSEAESREFFNASCHKRLNGQQLIRLWTRTEGWAASLQLAAIALDQVDDVSQLLGQFSGETRTVAQFLSDEVLRRLPVPMQRFLMETSVLRRFNSELARAVTGRDESRNLLDELEEKSLFIFSLDENRNWYRYHHLFADHLQRRLLDTDPDGYRDLHHRAAQWLAANGFPEDAIGHAFEASEIALAAELLDDACEKLFAAGQIHTLQAHAGKLSRETLERLPRLQLELAWEHELAWRFTDAQSAMQSVRTWLERHPAKATDVSPGDRAAIESKLAHRELMYALLSDRLDEAGNLARQWSASAPANGPLVRTSVATTLMQDNRERYVCKGASIHANQLHSVLVEAGAIYGTVYQDSVSGLTLFMRGELDEAEKYYVRARERAVSLQGEQSGLAAMPAALLAELFYERSELDRSRAVLETIAGSTIEFGFVDHPIARLLTLSRLAFCDKRRSQAADLLESGMAIATRYGMPRLYAHMMSERMRQLCAEGRAADVRPLLARSPFAGWTSGVASPAPSTTTELVGIALVRASCSRGQLAKEVQWLRRCLAVAREGDCVRSVARISATLARALYSNGDVAAGRKILHEALLDTPKGGFLRTYVDEGPVVADILRDLAEKLPDEKSPLGIYIGRILAEFGRTVPSDGESGGPQEVLSEREREILALTSKGMATSDISQTLGLTESTVKWYWQRIFSKLQVHRRFEAIKAARRSGLIN